MRRVLCLLISVLGVCVSEIIKKLKICVWMKYVAISFAVRNAVLSYEITVVDLTYVLSVG